MTIYEQIVEIVKDRIENDDLEDDEVYDLVARDIIHLIHTKVAPKDHKLGALNCLKDVVQMIHVSKQRVGIKQRRLGMNDVEYKVSQLAASLGHHLGGIEDIPVPTEGCPSPLDRFYASAEEETNDVGATKIA